MASEVSAEQRERAAANRERARALRAVRAAAAERAAERADERAAERADEHAAERADERATERADERAAERADERATERADERAAERAGGGFLPEREREGAVPRVAVAPAPIVDPAERPACLDCGRGLAHSYLFDTFQYAVCDECRDEEGAHALMTRTEARAEYMLRECDLDERGGALPCVRRRNPHAARGDMRLYVRAQVEARAREVWGGAARLAEERAAREQRRAAARARRGARTLRKLRMDVRSALFAAPRDAHEHDFAPETYDADADTYSRVCACGHRETYEKM